MRNQAPLHEPAFVAALAAHNDGNIGGSLGGDVKARRVARQIVVKVPTNPNVTKLERSGDAATHFERLRWWWNQRSTLFRCFASVQYPGCKTCTP
jgi:hypothetical protein